MSTRGPRRPLLSALPRNRVTSRKTYSAPLKDIYPLKGSSFVSSAPKHRYVLSPLSRFLNPINRVTSGVPALCSAKLVCSRRSEYPSRGRNSEISYRRNTVVNLLSYLINHSPYRESLRSIWGLPCCGMCLGLSIAMILLAHNAGLELLRSSRFHPVITFLLFTFQAG